MILWHFVVFTDQGIVFLPNLLEPIRGFVYLQDGTFCLLYAREHPPNKIEYHLQDIVANLGKAMAYIKFTC